MTDGFSQLLDWQIDFPDLCGRGKVIRLLDNMFGGTQQPYLARTCDLSMD
jgi:hypothetical protein